MTPRFSDLTAGYTILPPPEIKKSRRGTVFGEGVIEEEGAKMRSVWDKFLCLRLSPVGS